MRYSPRSASALCSIVTQVRPARQRPARDVRGLLKSEINEFYLYNTITYYCIIISIRAREMAVPLSPRQSTAIRHPSLAAHDIRASRLFPCDDLRFLHSSCAQPISLRQEVRAQDEFALETARLETAVCFGDLIKRDALADAWSDGIRCQ